MGTYATTTTLSFLMPGVNFSSANMSTIASKAIDHAEAEINKYLSKRYDLSASTFQTSSSIPPMVRTWAEQYSVGLIYQWNSRGAKESITRGEKMCEAVRKNLEMVSGYKADLLNTAGSVLTDMSQTAYSVRCNTSDYTPTFGEDDEKNWAVDPDKLEDIADTRD